LELLVSDGTTSEVASMDVTVDGPVLTPDPTPSPMPLEPAPMPVCVGIRWRWRPRR
jgi:hypothetical protein